MENKSNQTVRDLFEKQVKATPHNDAVFFKGVSLTYEELNERANKVANMLHSLNISRGDIVPIIIHRSIDLIAAIIGVIKSGAAYMPIDPKFPEKRIQYMLEESNSKLALIQKNINLAIPSSCSTHYIDEENSYPTTSVEVDLSADDLIYILYTSGSTGKPKGVMVEHKNIANYVQAFKDEFKIKPTDRVLQQSVVTFDIFTEELFPALLNGSAIVIVEDQVKEDPDKLMSFIDDNKVTIISVFPYLLNKLNKVKPLASSLRIAISGGDVLRPEYIKNMIGKVDIYNTYGPSETTVCATYHKYEEGDLASDRIPIGTPIKNYAVHLANQSGLIDKTGITGEILISGQGVSRGYLNRDDLTNKHFVYDERIGAKVYKTGDLGVYNESGEIEFISRKDDQVMIEGRRVEPGEVEKILYMLSNVKDAAVIPCKGSNDYYLCAYIVSKGSLCAEFMREHLSNFVPEFMIPEFFMQINEMPLTLNGKIDKKALSIPLK